MIMSAIQHIESAARRKLSAVSEWKGYSFEVVAGGYIVIGEIPMGVYSRGPKKGSPKWKGRGTKVIVSDADVKAETEKYVLDTGNCPDCLGTKEELVSWSATHGTKTRPCSVCAGSGRAVTSQFSGA
jgi:hypothetical protein